MSWSVGRPQDKWSDAEKTSFLREIYTRLKFGSFTWNPPEVPAASTVDTTLTTGDGEQLKGLRVGQPVYVTPPADLDAGIVVSHAQVAANDTLTIRLGNVTASPINPASGTWAFQGTVL